MSTIHLRIITPNKIVREDDVSSVTAPSVEGEITVLPRHAKLFSLLHEGIIKIKKGSQEEFLAIGGGYLETNGTEITLLVSRAHGQDEIDEKLTEKAIKDAEKIVRETKDETQRHEASAILRRSVVDMKLIKKRRRPLS